MPKFAKQSLKRAELTRAYRACHAGRANPRQKAIEALYLKVEELAEVAEPEAVHRVTYWMDGVLIHHVEINEDGTVPVGAMIPANFTFTGITDGLRLFAITEGSSPHPVKA